MTQNIYQTEELRIFRPKKDKVIKEWEELNEGLHSLYSSPNVIRVIQSRKMRWVSHVARTGEMRSACNILIGKPEGDNLEEKDEYGKIILRWILGNRVGRCGLDASGSRQ
jgi:hypothetical protein